MLYFATFQKLLCDLTKVKSSFADRTTTLSNYYSKIVFTFANTVLR